MALYILGSVVGGETGVVRGVHLHDEGVVVLPLLLGVLALEEEDVGGDDVGEHGEPGDGIAPADVVVVGVEDPGAVPTTATEHGEAEEEEAGDDAVADRGEDDHLPLEPG